MKMISAAMLAASVLSISMPVAAKPCAVTFTKASPAVENPSSVRRAGEVYYSPTVYEYNEATKSAVVCFRGEYCYRASTLKLGCSVDWSSGQRGLSQNDIRYKFK
jgi:hypothetical protein